MAKGVVEGAVQGAVQGIVQSTAANWWKLHAGCCAGCLKGACRCCAGCCRKGGGEVLYRFIKQNHKIWRNCFHTILTCTFSAQQPNANFPYRSSKKNKMFCYRPSKQNGKPSKPWVLSFWNQYILPHVTILFQAWNWVSSFGNPQFLTTIAA